jgi:Dullard-like phosphatase family protein
MLILDLDETLVHSSPDPSPLFDFIVNVEFRSKHFEIYVSKRPDVDSFLAQLLDEFEVFIFSASISEYSHAVVDTLLPGFPRDRVLSRGHCRFYNGTYVKDLAVFNSDLRNIIIVDNSEQSYCMQPENGVLVGTWTGDEKDRELLSKTLPLLRKCSRCDDVRSVIRG